MFAPLFLLALCTTSAFARPEGLEEEEFHPDIKLGSAAKLRTSARVEERAHFWRENAQGTILERLNNKPIESVAKNVILFLGDGMSIPTLAAARVYYGGEEMELSFEKLPHTALSKTYCVDAQTADSACTATAYLTGVKNNYGMIGVTAAVTKNDCEASLLEENQVESIAKWSQDVGKRTGIVTTSTVTDASPAGAYAKAANRDWQTDGSVRSSGADATTCRDITYQLVKWAPGKNFNVILGGGARKFLNNDTIDRFGTSGQRSDDLNLIEEWVNDRTAEGLQAEYVWNRSSLLSLDEDTDYVLGLFGSSYVPYNLDRNDSVTPSLEEMTEVAINIASKGNGADNGYFLFIEGGRIDHAHHDTWAKKALDETVEFSKAIQKALDLTSEEDTLIVVTADHAHTMSMSGYPDRANSILGIAGTDSNGGTRLTLNYANGPAPVNASHDYSTDDTTDDEYRFPAVTYKNSETHGADDVGIFARGPWAHLFRGVVEQNTIPHIMAYASCVGDGLTACSWAVRNVASMALPVLGVVLFLHV
ncbi:membrane-bound alkaline phosphatase [Anoplophora glabripennis]|uniref:membrane-bound alkaline phosphatase n=1 Tax=Anoplophora glabripennis TaxID=217634 RepID=UPI0008745E7E|nr:membrane-bound alkaline phosphatase [Anoplophora glabripennis]